MYRSGDIFFLMEKQDVYNAIEAAGLKVLEVYDDESFCVDPLSAYTGTAVVVDKGKLFLIGFPFM
jgi:hypothetical protein